MIKALLVFPPGWSPVGPYLALPVLKSFLREKKGIEVDIIDLNVEFYDQLLSFENVNRCLKRFARQRSCFSDRIVLTEQLIADSALNVEDAKSIFRSDRYFDLEQRQYAENVFRNALYIINQSSGGAEFTFNSIELPYSYYSTSDVMNSLDDYVSNPFVEFYLRGVLQGINDASYDFVGISVSGIYQVISSMTLSKQIKTMCPSVKHVSLGGNYITRLADTLMGDRHPFFKYIDSIMMYDGEESLACLLETLDGDSPTLENVPNLCYVQEGFLKKNAIIEQTIINDTTPDFDGFSLSKYFMPELIMPLYSSRQCFNHCAFCAIPGATGGCYRKMSINRVYEIMCDLNRKYGSRIFSFVDETFESRRMTSLANLIVEGEKEFFWHAETRFSPSLSADSLKTIYLSGCRQIQFGLESYNQRILNLMKKNTKIEWIDANIFDCLSAGIPVHLFFMIGFPSETREEALRTLKYTEQVLFKSKTDYGVPYSTRGFTNFGLVMGSDVWDHPEAYGVTPMLNTSSTDLRLEVDYETSSGLTSEEARAISDEHHIDFYMKEMTNGATVIELPPRLHISEVTWILDSIHEVKYTGNMAKIRTSLISLNVDSKIEFDSMTSALTYKEDIIFYNARYHHIYILPNEYSAQLRKIAQSHFKVSDALLEFNEDFITELEGLIFYGILNVGEQSTYTASFEGFRLFKNPLIKEVGVTQEGLHVILSLATHRMSSMSGFALALIDLFKEPRDIQAVKSIMEDNGFGSFIDSLDILIEKCIRADIIHIIR